MKEDRDRGEIRCVFRNFSRVGINCFLLTGKFRREVLGFLKKPYQIEKKFPTPPPLNMPLGEMYM